MKNLLIIGNPRVGKTTLIESIVNEFKDRVGGFITKEFKQNGERQGFEIVTLDGQKSVLADKDFASNYKVSKYGVNIDNLEQIGVPAVERALTEKEIIVIDEIGNMEIASKKFCEVVEKALKSKQIVLATIHAYDNPFSNMIKKREDVQIFELTQENKEQIKRDIVQKIESLC